MISYHYDILRAIERADGDAAESAIRNDIDAAIRYFRKAGVLASELPTA